MADPIQNHHMNSLLNLFPPHLIIMSQVVLSKSVALSTLSNYLASLIRFMRFFDDYAIPESFCMPVSEPILTMFITCQGTASVSKSTMHHWLLGIKLWYEINGAPWHGRAVLKRAVKVMFFLMHLSW